MFWYINPIIQTWLCLVSFINIHSSTSSDSLKYTQREVQKERIRSQAIRINLFIFVPDPSEPAGMYQAKFQIFTKTQLLSESLRPCFIVGFSGVGLPGGPVVRGQPKGRRASQSHIMAGPVGQP